MTHNHSSPAALSSTPRSGAGRSRDETNLTQAQFLMWLGQQMNPDAPLYNMIQTFTIVGDLDAGAFQAAFQALVDGSDALRTVVEVDQGVPRQRVLEPFDARVPFLDFSAQPDPNGALQSWVEQRKVTMLALDQRLFDTALIKLDQQTHVWYLCQHHLITDGQSFALTYRALANLYGLAREGRLSEAPALPAYADYVAFERAFRQSDEWQEATAYWREKVAESLPPTDFYGRRAGNHSGRTDRIQVDVGPERSRRLREIAMADGFASLSEDLSLFTVWATLLLTVIHRLSGRQTLRLGTPFQARRTPAQKNTIGLFIEIGPLQVTIGEDETFVSLGEQVMGETFAGLMHAQPGVSDADLNRSYDVLLNFVNARFDDFAGLPVQTAWVHTGFGDSDHALRLQITDFDGTGSFRLHFDVNAELFGAAQRRWLVDQFNVVIDTFIADHEQALGGFDLLTVAERRDYVEQFNATDADYPHRKTVVDLFEAQVAATPQAVAVARGAHTLTYAQLNARANRLARHLRELGLVDEQTVAICMERSLEAVVAILGILKAGGAYVPVDPAYPALRRRTMMADAQPLAIVTAGAQPFDLSGDGVPVLNLDALDLSAVLETNLARTLPPERLVYMIYTSGSTGQPKGTMLTHRGLINYIWWARQVYQQDAALDFPLYSSLAFDLTVTSIFVPLTSGGRVVVYSEADHPRGLEILSVFEDDAVDIVKLTPAHLGLVREAAANCRRIRTLIVGGEDFKTELAHQIHDAFGSNVTIYNEYGPTEAVVGCMIHRYDPERDTALSVPIGAPAANARIYLLDQYGQPVPSGVLGEMVISGDGVARGYHNRPDLTADRFAPDPFRPGARIYRTGDVARWGEDGRLVFLGRRDFQVKIRGARIELGEIEAALLEHPLIEAAVVDVVQFHNAAPAAVENCAVCGLPSNYPDANFDDAGVCGDCRAFAEYRLQVDRYFRTPDDLRHVLDQVKQAEADATYDCLILLSGGKDSTYMLYRLVRDFGLRPLAFSLDNGYISEEALDNVRRACADLGVDLKIATTPHMNAIFADSLRRHSNVCDGCYKTIYTLSMSLARRLGISTIITGLARGQLFETRLADTFRARLFDPKQIDSWVMDARKAYHHINDAVYELLETDLFQDDRIFGEIRFIDFYRYVDVGLDEVYDFLDRETVWRRPSDTGRSTNCLINDVGIYIHQKERGFHNYALPYSWDVRLGHKERATAMDELDDDIDEDRVRRILAEIGYESPVEASGESEKRLAAYYVGTASLSASDLRHYLGERLPDFMLPTYLMQLEQLPLTVNGKVDRRALPDPAHGRPDLETRFVAPTTEREQRLAEVWAEALRLPEVGIHDNFFDLGGDSIISIQIVAGARRAGLHLTPRQLFSYQTIAELADVVAFADVTTAEQGLVTGDVPLTPIQQWFFAQDFVEPNHWNQSLWLDLPADAELGVLQEALQLLPRQHDVLRLRFHRTPAGWRQSLSSSIPAVAVHLFETMDPAAIEREARALEEGLDIETGTLLQAGLFRQGADRPVRLFLTVHHLAIDGVSWRPLLEDLETAYFQLRDGAPPALPAKTTSFKRWAEQLVALADDAQLAQEAAYWEAGTATRRFDAAAETAQDTVNAARTVSVTLPEEATGALLHEIGAAYNTQINDALLTAVALAFREEMGGETLSATVEGHGREEHLVDLADLSRTVGWFTTHFPVHLTPGDAALPGEALKTVKEQLRRVPRHGIGYGLLRHLRGGALQDEPEILFNYLGQFERSLPSSRLFTLREPLQAGFGSRNRRTHALEINAYVRQEQLHVDWVYNPARTPDALAGRLAGAFIAALERLIDHCRSKGEREFTPSDFDLASLDDADFARVAARLGPEGMAQTVDIYPLTPTQTGILYHALRAPDSAVYFEQISCTLHGELDLARLQAAWQQVADRHPMLRTRLLWEDLDAPLQIVQRSVELPWDIIDWRAGAPAAPAAALAALRRGYRQRGFDLAQAPLLSFALVRESEQRTHFVWNTHHILVDGWSTHQLFHEAFAVYDALGSGTAPALAPARPFRDYVAWQQQQDQALAETFWRENLAGFAAPTPLQVDRRAADEEVAFGRQSELLPAETTAALKALAQRERVTLNTVLQSAWGLLLNRYSGQGEVVFGTTVSGRPADLPHVGHMVGMFINTLPLRLSVPSEQPLSEWLGDVQERHLALRQVEYTPLADVQRWSELPAGQALFDSIVVFENYPAAEAQGPQSLEIADLDYREQSNYPLALLVVPGERLQLLVIYNRARFEDAAIARLLHHLRHLLLEMANYPQRPLGRLSPLSEDERHRLLFEWNETAQTGPGDRLLHELIAAQAARQPDASAVQADGHTLTYGALDRRANSLAHALQAQGVGPDSFVGLFTARRLELVVGILGILKAGAAYVPIDPDYPAERIQHIIADTGLEIILTAGGVAPDLPAGSARLLDLDTFDDGVYPDTLPSLQPTPEQLAYVIYTSGSTGQPKGVMVTHANIVHSTTARFDFYPEPVARFLLLSSFAFDSSMVGIFWTLCQGGTLLLPRPGLHQDVLYLNELIERERVTHLLALPSLYQLLLDESEPRQLDSLNTVIVAGEACHPGLVAAHYARQPAAALYNEYGPTEGTVWSHAYRFPADFEATEVPIGKPIPNVTAYIVDAEMRPVPVGVPGELILGGAGIARGYLNRPELTAERFIHLPAALGAAPEARFYRTGDLVRRRADGHVVFLGRVDQQVKIRGFRIEIGEIEAALHDHPSIRAAVVDVIDLHREAPDGGAAQERRAEKRLAAWLVADEGLTTDALRLFLGRRLPDYMIPAFFTRLDELPRTPNGKIDRRALPDPESGRQPDAYVAPVTERERRLAAIWAEVLRLPQVGIHDNFFDLGGDSIISIQIIARARRVGLQLTPRQVFDHQTIHELAARAAAAGASTAEQGLVQGDVPLTPIQQWFFDQELASPAHWNQSIWLELPADVDPALLAQAAQALPRQHDALRLRFRRTAAGWRQTLAETVAPLEVQLVDPLDEAEMTRRAAALEGKLDIEAGPLLRMALFRAGPGRKPRLFITIHHLVVDGVSWRPLLEDLETAYRQLAAGDPLRLPAKTTSFKRWSELLWDYAAGDAVRRERAYWAALPEPERLEVAPGIANVEAEAETLAVSLTAERTLALLNDVGGAYNTTVQDALLTAATQAVGATLGWRRFAVMLEGHGREEVVDAAADLSRSVGWFTSRFPVALALEHPADSGAALKAVKEQLRAVPNFGIGYGLLRYLDGAGEARMATEPNVIFNYLGQLDRSLPSTDFLAPIGPLRGGSAPDNRRTHALGVMAYVQNGQLAVVWEYHPALLPRDQVQALADHFLTQLQALMDHCLARGEREYTASDFALAELDSAEFDQLADFLSGLDE